MPVKTKPLPSRETLVELLEYDAGTGKFTWKPRSRHWFVSEGGFKSWNSQYAGTEAFTYVDSVGYRQGALCGQSCRAHRVAWKIIHGTEPEQVDHIDGNWQNNRIANLRNVSAAENRKNMRIRVDNATGAHGVCERNGKFRARIYLNGREHYIGTFGNIGDAIAARKAKEIEMSFHENHGRAA